MKRLSNATHRHAYDRAATTIGIVHLGIGNFHRAHMAVYTEDCLARGAPGWAIAGVSLQRPDMRDRLAPQDGLYSFVERENGDESLRVIGALKALHVAPEDPAGLIERMARPETRIVSLTVTEKGYCANIAAGALDLAHPDIIHDLANPHAPRSALGFIHAALAARRARQLAPFTLLSCDNLPQNGKLLKKLVAQFAAASGSGLQAFVEDEVASPCAMVDRIVPATTDALRQQVADRLGLVDEAPVAAERFSQWVIEDRFSLGRPAWEQSGAEFVPDVEPFEKMKLRLLNGSHSALAAIGLLAGFQTVAQAFAAPDIRRFIEGYWREAAQTLPRGIDAAAYTQRLAARFSNTSLNHQLAQIATDASQKVPQRILAPLGEILAAGRPSPHLVLAVAAWIASCARPEMNDPRLTNWGKAPDQSEALPGEVVAVFLSNRAVFADAFAANPAFVAALASAQALIRNRGVMDALEGL